MIVVEIDELTPCLKDDNTLVSPIPDMQGVFITWMCTAPLKNKQLENKPRYQVRFRR